MIQRNDNNPFILQKHNLGWVLIQPNYTEDGQDIEKYVLPGALILDMQKEKPELLPINSQPAYDAILFLSNCKKGYYVRRWKSETLNVAGLVAEYFNNGRVSKDKIVIETENLWTDKEMESLTYEDFIDMFEGS